MSRDSSRDPNRSSGHEAGRDAVAPWSVPVSLSEVSATGRHLVLVADATVRAAVARSIGLRDLPRLEATLNVSRYGRDGLRVDGVVSATVGQTCVVTLEPMESDIEEPVDVVFAPVASPAADDGTVSLTEDAPEPLVGGRIDLGAVATEFLTIGIDPYPRKAGAEFATPVAADDAGHPFAALATLKTLKKTDGHDG